MEKEINYETFTINSLSDEETKVVKSESSLLATDYDLFSEDTSTAKSVRGKIIKHQKAYSQKKFQLEKPLFAVKRSGNLTPIYENIEGEAKAYQLLKELQAKHPKEQYNFDVVPMHELAVVA